MTFRYPLLAVYLYCIHVCVLLWFDCARVLFSNCLCYHSAKSAEIGSGDDVNLYWITRSWCLLCFSGRIPRLSLIQHRLYVGVVEKSPSRPLTGE